MIEAFSIFVAAGAAVAYSPAGGLVVLAGAVVCLAIGAKPYRHADE